MYVDLVKFLGVQMKMPIITISSANVDDGSCIYYSNCTDASADNYDSSANTVVVFIAIVLMLLPITTILLPIRMTK